MKILTIKVKKVDVKFINLLTGIISKNDRKSFINIKCYDNFMKIYDIFNKYDDFIFTDMLRTQHEQFLIYQDRKRHPEKGIASGPTKSMHLYGKAFDIYTKGFKNINYDEFVKICKENKFTGISSENWHFQFIESGNPFEERKYMCKDLLPLSQEDIMNHIKLAGYNSIKDFQSKFGLVIDGIAGYDTQITLLLYNSVIEIA